MRFLAQFAFYLRFRFELASFDCKIAEYVCVCMHVCACVCVSAAVGAQQLLASFKCCVVVRFRNRSRLCVSYKKASNFKFRIEMH